MSFRILTFYKGLLSENVHKRMLAENYLKEHFNIKYTFRNHSICISFYIMAGTIITATRSLEKKVSPSLNKIVLQVRVGLR